MSRHNGVKPPRQPRSLRSIAEGKSNPGNFPEGPEADPLHTTSDGQSYVDEAAKAQPSSASRGLTSADPQPFNVSKR